MPAQAQRKDGEAPADALLVRIATGDEQAFAALVGRYQGRFFGVARRLLDDDAEAEDAVQTTFLRVFRSAGAYRDQWSGSTWLYRILTNVCVDQWRKRRATDVSDALDETPAPARGTERIDVDRALAKLPTEARAILVLCYVEDLSYAEIARARGISVNTVKTQLARAKRSMRAHLNEGEKP